MIGQNPVNLKPSSSFEWTTFWLIDALFLALLEGAM
jgi:hypothetical protein